MAGGGSLVRIASAEQSAIAKEKRADGRPRLPPGQRTLEYLRPMGGDEGDPDPRKFSLKVFGNVKTPFSVDYAGLLKLPQVEKTADVHCVTGWSMLGGLWKGVQIAMLAEKAGMKGDTKHVILESAHGFTANIPLREATVDYALITYRLNGKPFAIYVICRRLWEKNLTIVRQQAEAHGGRFIAGEHFDHWGGNVGSLIRTISYALTSGDKVMRLFGIRLPVPQYGLSDTAMARVMSFTREVAGKVNG